VFFTEEDRAVYLDWMKEYCGKHQVEILAYCFMINPIHLVAIPERLATSVETVAHALWAKS
jgi:REP element-mobilizing transposase RayT